jgi:error-prone DNA polymerase
MSSDPFVHLHAASGYSLRHGASHPHVLVQRAAEHGMEALALTDRDGLYGAVRFAKACRAAGIRPIFGVDLAVEPSGLLVGVHPSVRAWSSKAGSERAPASRAQREAEFSAPGRTPARGGATVDPRYPRVTLLAADGRGWAALCRLVSATHLRGERGRPVSTLDLVAEHAELADGGLLAMLGPLSEAGRAMAVRRPDIAGAVFRQWRAAFPTENLLVEVVSHRGEGDSPRAGRMLRLAAEEGLTGVLTNAVRYADRADAAVADVLDASRRLVPLDVRHVDRVNAEGFLKSGKEMALVAEEVTRAAGLGESAAARLIAATRRVAERCAVDVRRDLGLGEIHFPELEVAGSAGTRGGTGGGGLVVSRDESGSATGRSGGEFAQAGALLRERCEAGIGRRYPGASTAGTQEIARRLDDELGVIAHLGYPSYFLTVADVVDLIREMDVRVAARGSGAGSLVNYLLGISGVDPMRHGLLMERFLSPLRAQLPDIDIDVESARRTEVYERILQRFGGDRCTCVSMMDTYRVRHAIRDVGAALGLPPGEIDSIAKAFPHIRARDARLAMQELPELRASGIAGSHLDLLFRLVERLDGLPRHVALHPCGVLLSDRTLLDRTPVEASWLGFPMSQFDKDDVEDLGLLKLDVLGIRMQSAMSHAVAEVERVDGTRVDLDDELQVPFDDADTFELIQSTRTLGMFQIESPGQRELVGKFGPRTFADIIIDISLFRPGPVKSDMVTPFLEARQGWRLPEYLHPDLEPALAETAGVVVFHEQVLKIFEVFTGCTLAEADEARRALGDAAGQPEVRTWFRAQAFAKGYDVPTVERVWEVLVAFGSFGFCKAHAAAFALPTYQSAWLKAHHPAAFLAGVLTHDPGMYPKRLLLDDARHFGIAVLGLDVNRSDGAYRVERVSPDDRMPGEEGDGGWKAQRDADGSDGQRYGIRLGLADVKGISAAEVSSIVAGRPYGALSDFWHRAGVSRPIVERLVVAGGFDSVYGIGGPTAVRRRGTLTRRDLLLQVGELERWTRAASRQRGPARRRTPGGAPAAARLEAAVAGSTAGAAPVPDRSSRAGGPRASGTSPYSMGADVRERAALQSKAARPPAPTDVQLPLDLGDSPDETIASGLPDMDGAERVRAELEVLGLDVSRHVVDFYAPFLEALGVTRSVDMLKCRSKADVLVAGVKVATQTPPIRSGKRVVFITLDDGTGPVDATFFEDAQGLYAATLFHSWLLVVRGEVRRTGPRGVSMRATGCWELPVLHGAWSAGGMEAALDLMTDPAGLITERAVTGAAASRSTRPVMARPPVGSSATTYEPHEDSAGSGAGGMRSRRVLVHPTGFRQSPYADVKPPGGETRGAPRKLWHSSPGSSGG